MHGDDAIAVYEIEKRSLRRTSERLVDRFKTIISMLFRLRASSLCVR